MNCRNPSIIEDKNYKKIINFIYYSIRYFRERIEYEKGGFKSCDSYQDMDFGFLLFLVQSLLKNPGRWDFSWHKMGKARILKPGTKKFEIDDGKAIRTMG